jgi:hypothetical protein
VFNSSAPHLLWSIPQLSGSIVSKITGAAAREPYSVTPVYLPLSNMSTSNRYQALAAFADQEESPPQTMKETQALVAYPGQNHLPPSQGWEEDMQGIFDDEDPQTDGTEVIDDDNRRRKVSTGPREAHAPEMTFAFPPARLGVPGTGRGGGCRAEDGTAIGTLPPIIETAEGDTEGPVESGMDD